MYAILVFLTLLNVYFMSFSVRNGEINFFNDVGRDFLLLRELDEKKIVLIGPRSNISGLYHGPLWSYVNYPAYLLGKGDPVTLGWFWIFLGISALGLGFIGARKLFGTLPALVFILLYSHSLTAHINGMFHSEAPVFLTPFLFFTIVLYAKYKKIRYLIFHLFIAAMIIQLNVGVGIPMLILSLLLIVYLIIKNKLWKHLFAFALIPLFLANFIIFDVRHNFLLSKSAYEFSQFQRIWTPVSTDFWIRNRIESTVHLQIVESLNYFLILPIFLSVLFFSIREIKTSKKYKTVYFLFLYYYLGYMLLSFANKGVILGHFIYLLVPLTSLWFASFLRNKYQLVFLPLLVVIAFLNFQHGLWYIRNLQTSFMEKRQESWRGLLRVADSVLAKTDGKPFGYFVFSPDAFAYGPRYGMIYKFKKANAQASEYVKMQNTFVVSAPAPANDPYMTYVWWVKNPVGIKSESAWKEEFPNGFTALEYKLTSEEQKIPHDKNIELGIHFR